MKTALAALALVSAMGGGATESTYSPCQPPLVFEVHSTSLLGYASTEQTTIEEWVAAGCVGPSPAPIRGSTYPVVEQDMSWLRDNVNSLHTAIMGQAPKSHYVWAESGEENIFMIQPGCQLHPCHDRIEFLTGTTSVRASDTRKISKWIDQGCWGVAPLPVKGHPDYPHQTFYNYDHVASLKAVKPEEDL